VLSGIQEYYSNHKIKKIHGKNDFIEISKNLARYRSENNFVGLSIIVERLCRTLTKLSKILIF